MNHLLFTVRLLAVVIVTTMMVPAAHAVTYIGDAAAQGPALTNGGGPRADTVGTLTYVSTAPGTTYTAPGTQLIVLKEVNFFADLGGTLTPFVASYDGGNGQLGASYTVLVKGDPITVTPAGAGGLGPNASDQLVNMSFLVGGENPTLHLNDGDVIAAGWLQNGTIVYIGGAGTQGVADYIRNGDSLTGAAIGGNLTANSNFAFDRTMQFNIGFVVIPEPATAALGLMGLAGLLMRRRKSA